MRNNLYKIGSVSGLLILLSVGCQGETFVIPRGQVIRDGKPVRTTVQGKLKILYEPVTAGGGPPPFTYTATTLGKGGYEIKGLRGVGIPPGKYRVSVRISAERSDVDQLNGQFAGARSPFEHEVVADGPEYVIDLGKK